jgi:hypothetical protein
MLTECTVKRNTFSIYTEQTNKISLFSILHMNVSPASFCYAPLVIFVGLLFFRKGENPASASIDAYGFLLKHY